MATLSTKSDSGSSSVSETSAPTPAPPLSRRETFYQLLGFATTTTTTPTAPKDAAAPGGDKKNSSNQRDASNHNAAGDDSNNNDTNHNNNNTTPPLLEDVDHVLASTSSPEQARDVLRGMVADLLRENDAMRTELLAAQQELVQARTERNLIQNEYLGQLVQLKKQVERAVGGSCGFELPPRSSTAILTPEEATELVIQTLSNKVEHLTEYAEGVQEELRKAVAKMHDLESQNDAKLHTIAALEAQFSSINQTRQQYVEKQKQAATSRRPTTDHPDETVPASLSKQPSRAVVSPTKSDGSIPEDDGNIGAVVVVVSPTTSDCSTMELSPTQSTSSSSMENDSKSSVVVGSPFSSDSGTTKENDNQSSIVVGSPFSSDSGSTKENDNQNSVVVSPSPSDSGTKENDNQSSVVAKDEKSNIITMNAESPVSVISLRFTTDVTEEMPPPFGFGRVFIGKKVDAVKRKNKKQHKKVSSKACHSSSSPTPPLLKDGSSGSPTMMKRRIMTGGRTRSMSPMHRRRHEKGSPTAPLLGYQHYSNHDNGDFEIGPDMGEI